MRLRPAGTAATSPAGGGGWGGVVKNGGSAEEQRQQRGGRAVAVAGVGGAEEAVEAGALDKAWGELTDAERGVAEALGYTPASFDGTVTPPISRPWTSLEPRQRAQVRRPDRPNNSSRRCLGMLWVCELRAA
jgi:hypothetical protein